MALAFSYITDTKQISFSEDSDFWITGVNSLSSNEIAISETQGVGQIGSTRSAQSIKPKDLTVSGILFGDLSKNREQLLAAIRPEAAARFVITDDSGSWYLEGTPSRTPLIEETPVQQAFQFVFHAPYPYWRSMDDINTILAGVDALFQFPLNTGGSWYISRYEKSLFKRIVNSGNEPVAVTVIMEADAKVLQPEVRIVETGSFLRITKTMEAGERIVICTVYGQKSVTCYHSDGTKENGFRHLSPDSDMNMELMPGVNTLRYIAAENREGLRVTVSAPKGVRAGV